MLKFPKRTSTSSRLPADFDRSLILPEHYVDQASEEIAHTKIAAQQRATMGQLRRLTVLP
jgi:hypothetical protein